MSSTFQLLIRLSHNYPFEIVANGQVFVHSQTSLELLTEDIVAALDNKNPGIQAETARFLARCFARQTLATLPKKQLKTFCGSLVKV